MYFDPTFVASFYDDYLSVIAYIEYLPIGPYMHKIEKSLSDISVTCNKFQSTSSLHIDCNDTVNPLKILISANNLKYDSLSLLVPINETRKQTKRYKRGLVDAGGKLLKFLFGTLDADDTKRYDDAFAAIQENENEIYQDMNENIRIVKSTINTFNDTINKLIENEKKLNEYLQKLNEVLTNQTKDIDNLKNAARIDSVFNLLESSLMSVSNILDAVLNSILFAKTNNLHPYVLTPTKLYEVLQNQNNINNNLRLPVTPFTLQNIHSIIDVSKLTSYIYDNKIVFVMKIPLISSDKYDVYKILPLPTPRVENGVETYVLIHPTKLYMALTDIKNTRSPNYALLDNVNDCQKVNNEYICPLPSIISSTTNNPTCETKLINEAPNSLPKICDSKVIYGNINLWQKLNNGSYIYVQSKPSKLSIQCPNQDKDHDYTIQGTGILTLEDDCTAYFESLQFKPSSEFTRTVPRQLNINFNIIEDDCCKFKLENSSTHIFTPITLTDINLESLKSASDKLDRLDFQIEQAENQPHIVKYGSFYSTTMIIVIAVISVFIVYTVFVKCKNANAAPVILHQRFP